MSEWDSWENYNWKDIKKLIKEEMKMKTTIANNIRYYRQISEMSQMELYKRTGIPNKRLSAYERGVNNIDAIHLHLIAQALKTPMENFFIDLELESKSPLL